MKRLLRKSLYVVLPVIFIALAQIPFAIIGWFSGWNFTLERGSAGATLWALGGVVTGCVGIFAGIVFAEEINKEESK